MIEEFDIINIIMGGSAIILTVVFYLISKKTLLKKGEGK